MQDVERWPPERVRVLSKLEGMGPRPPVVGLTFGEKWAFFSVSLIGKKDGIGTDKKRFADLVVRNPAW